MILQEVLCVREKKLGPEAMETLETELALGRIHKAQRKFPEAEERFRKVVTQYELQLGYKHRETLLAQNLLALTLQAQRKYAEAEKMFKRVVAMGEQVSFVFIFVVVLKRYCDEEYAKRAKLKQKKN